MNKLLAVLIAGLFSVGAFAQGSTHASKPVHKVSHKPTHHMKTHKPAPHHHKAPHHNAM
jgi:hypothetical protein